MFNTGVSAVSQDLKETGAKQWAPQGWLEAPQETPNSANLGRHPALRGEQRKSSPPPPPQGSGAHSHLRTSPLGQPTHDRRRPSQAPVGLTGIQKLGHSFIPKDAEGTHTHLL